MRYHLAGERHDLTAKIAYQHCESRPNRSYSKWLCGSLADAGHGTFSGHRL